MAKIEITNYAGWRIAKIGRATVTQMSYDSIFDSAIISWGGTSNATIEETAQFREELAQATQHAHEWDKDEGKDFRTIVTKLGTYEAVSNS